MRCSPQPVQNKTAGNTNGCSPGLPNQLNSTPWVTKKTFQRSCGPTAPSSSMNTQTLRPTLTQLPATQVAGKLLLSSLVEAAGKKQASAKRAAGEYSAAHLLSLDDAGHGSIMLDAWQPAQQQPGMRTRGRAAASKPGKRPSRPHAAGYSAAAGMPAALLDCEPATGLAVDDDEIGQAIAARMARHRSKRLKKLPESPSHSEPCLSEEW